jgi:uncharacterized membrane protein YkoI
MGRLIGVWLLSMALLSAVAADSDIDQDEARRLRESGDILPLTEILNVARTTHPGRIIEVELERERGHYIYEIELLDEDGQVLELKYDAASGVLLEKELED